MKDPTGGKPDIKRKISFPSLSVYDGHKYSKLLLNFNVKFIGTSLMKKGAEFVNSTIKSE